METRYCRVCDQGYPEEYGFCPECGSKLEVQAERQAPQGQTRAKVRNSGAEPSREPRTNFKFVLEKMARGGSSRQEIDIPEGGLVIGRTSGDVLTPEDKAVSPQHVRLIRKNDSLVMDDLGSHNGILLRIRKDTPLDSGDIFLCGDQVFRVEFMDQMISQDEWKSYLAPNEERPLGVIVHLLQDGCEGEVFPITSLPLTIGREEGEVRFPYDRFMSRKHTAIKIGQTNFVLSDLGSRNGTYLRVTGTIKLAPKDMFMVGKQLFRVKAVTQ